MLKSILKKILNFYKQYTNAVLEYKRSVLLQKHGLIALNHIIEILEKNKIIYWVDAGTLLGIVRDNTFMPNDNDTDIDIAIIIDNPEDLYKTLIENDYNIWYYYEDKDERKNLIRAEKYNVGIDFEIFFKKGEKYFYDAARPLPKSIERQAKNQFAILRFEFDANIIEKRIQYQLHDIILNIPENYTEYLSTYYENWKVRVGKKKFINLFYGTSVDNYKHHNAKAYYEKGHYLYFYKINNTSITVNLLDVILFLTKSRKSKISSANQRG